MNELIAILIIVGGVCLLLFIAYQLFSLGKKGVQKGVQKSKEVVVSISSQIEKNREEQLRKKLIEIAGEEYIRELVRRAMREGIEPAQHRVCENCRGQGCSYCGDTGWVRIGV